MDTDTDVKIRPADPTDAAGLLALQATLDRESRYMLLEPGERGTELPDPSYRLICFDGEPVGYVDVSVLPYARARGTGYVVMGVRSSHAGRGLGRALLEAAIARAHDRGLRRLELTVMTHNRAALGLYLRCGFRIEGLRRAALHIDGTDIDEYYMGRLLRPTGTVPGSAVRDSRNLSATPGHVRASARDTSSADGTADGPAHTVKASVLRSGPIIKV
ncbi:GNAT family N-acetyltransferase [Embleya sp. NBC_00896]|uniref:GNAT family N-acetyltransferase n=1 Tax=Embleya sp. NBC_00896 TaxID=2975961 RepID=UPI002F91B342|nr:GNAT family N-acetyltransferase [Embleya sp. NBC_00896]